MTAASSSSLTPDASSLPVRIDRRPAVFLDRDGTLSAPLVRDGKPYPPATAQEFKLLGHFVTHPGHTFSREELLSGAWGYGYEGTARTVDNFVSQLRAKFEPNPDEPKHFKTVRGLGYRFDP